MGPEETLSSIESQNRLAIPSISDVAIVIGPDSARKYLAPGNIASPTSSILTNPTQPLKIMNQSSS